MEWLLLLGFAFFDYLGYNIIARWSNVFYRILQTLVQIAATWYAWTQFGWFTAIAWNFLWWAWLADLFYYMLYDLLKWFGYHDGDYGTTWAALMDEKAGWRKRPSEGYDIYAENLRPLSAFEDQVLGGIVTWIYWTPLGLIKWAATGDKTKPFTPFEIFMQLLVMLTIYAIGKAVFG